MSETVHYKGTAKAVHKPSLHTWDDVARMILRITYNETVKPSWFKNELEWLCYEHSDDYFFYVETQTLYSITKNTIDADGDIINAKEDINGNVDYEVRYYNGGASFQEALGAALDKIYK